MPQPRRVGYSCYAEPVYHFPSLGMNCQKLFTYGANGRADADIRSRPMLPSLHKDWKWSHLKGYVGEGLSCDNCSRAQIKEDPADPYYFDMVQVC